MNFGVNAVVDSIVEDVLADEVGTGGRVALQAPLQVEHRHAAEHAAVDQVVRAAVPDVQLVGLHDPDVTFKVRYDDFVDVFAGRLDPRRAMLTGRLRPHGSVKALWTTRRLFG